MYGGTGMMLVENEASYHTSACLLGEGAPLPRAMFPQPLSHYARAA